MEPGLLDSLAVLCASVPGQRHQFWRHAIVRGGQGSDDFVAIQSGQADVDERDVGSDRERGIDATRPVPCLVDFVTVDLEQGAQHLADVVVVLDDEDARTGRDG